MKRKPTDGSFRITRWNLNTWDRTAVALLGFIFCYLVVPYLPRLLPYRRNTGGDSKYRYTMSELSDFRDAIDQFRIDCGRYPTNQEGLNALVDWPKGLSGWQGPYLKQGLHNDAWGNAYVYKTPSRKGNDYEVESYAADGQPGGDDDAEDIIVDSAS